ncbi:MAG: hypothetical protein ACLPOO_15725 [Terriglobales bacterium]
MKSKIMLLILALTVVSWAQTATQSTNPGPAPATPATSSDAKAQCPCCQKAADVKPEMSCCAHPAKAGASEKAAMSCCEGKDAAMACMKSKPGESANATPTNGKCCGSDQKDCCGKSGKGGEQPAMACCNGAGGHCGMDHQHNQGGMNK